MKTLLSEPLSKYTSFRTGGPAKFLIDVASVEELCRTVALTRQDNLPFVILGEGTNVLVSDEGYEGYVIRPQIKGIDFETRDLIVVGAGEHWDDMVHETVLKNLSGIENLSLIPGSTGAAPVQNIGAYGVEIADTIEWVEVFDTETSLVRKMTNEECDFGYRDSLFKGVKGKKYIITRVAMRLVPNGRPNISYKDLAEFFANSDRTSTIAEVRDAVMQIRKAKLPDPELLGTAGSFFKNPTVSDQTCLELSKKFPGIPLYIANPGFKKIPLAWILDKVCNLNGYTVGNVGLYKTQPLALVNFGGATSHEIKNFAEKISEEVKNKTNLNIEWEVNKI